MEKLPILSRDFLLINPWIYDFAAFNYWAKPYGLYDIAGQLINKGYGVHLIDCMDEDYGKEENKFGKGRYTKTKVPKHYYLNDVPRNFSRYGIKYEDFIRNIKGFAGSDVRFNCVLVTSMMTYWYPGVFEVIRVVRELLGDIPIFLGGIYASLCYDHAKKFSGADYVIKGDFSEFLSLIPDISTYEEKYPSYPAFYLQQHIGFIPIFTSKGCPFRCMYCASKFLNTNFIQKNPDDVVEEILFWHKRYNVIDFAFYDDALLVNAESHLAVILEGILQYGLRLRFHTPNAIHARFITKEIARLMKVSGFKTIRLGLENIEEEFHSNYDKKLKLEEFQMASAYLLWAGFKSDELGAYILMGLPDMDCKTVIKTAEYSAKCGIPPYLSEYSPIPHTALWKRSVEVARYPISIDPLFQNNTILPCVNPIDWDAVQRVKNYVRSLRKTGV